MLMMRRNWLVIVLSAVVLAAGAYLLFSQYLVSKLDGTGGVSTPQETGMVRYTSPQGVTFLYPDTYDASARPEGSERLHDIVLLPRGYTPPQGGEGPPAIVLTTIYNRDSASLEQWIRNDVSSNWNLAEQNEVLKSMTVGGEPALAYKHGGLYETDVIAVVHDDTVYLFEAGWINVNDQIRQDLQDILKSVQFTDAR